MSAETFASVRHCFLCGNDYPRETRMVLARGGSEICESCAQTARGQKLTADPDHERYAGYRRGYHDPRRKFQRAIAFWTRGGRRPV